MALLGVSFQRVAVLEFGFGQRVALHDERGGVVVQDRLNRPMTMDGVDCVLGMSTDPDLAQTFKQAHRCGCRDIQGLRRGAHGDGD